MPSERCHGELSRKNWETQISTYFTIILSRQRSVDGRETLARSRTVLVKIVMKLSGDAVVTGERSGERSGERREERGERREEREARGERREKREEAGTEERCS